MSRLLSSAAAPPNAISWRVAAPVIALPVALVVAVDPAGYAPFGPAKHVVFSVLVLVGLVALLAARRTLRCDRWPALAWCLLLGWLGLAASLGVDTFHGWVGLPERRLGVVTWALLAICFVLGQSLRGPERRALVLTASVAGCVVGGWSLLEGFGVAPVDVAGSTSRLGGPFGSAAYLGAACCLLVPVGVGVALDHDVSLRWRAVGAAAAVTCGIGLVGSGTRGAWVGIACAAVATAVGRRRSISWRGHPAKVVAAGVIGAVLVGGWLLPEAERPGDALGRVGSSGRLDEWSLAGRVLADRPLLGAGPEGYRIVAGQHVTADYERAYGRAVIPDRAHNGLLDLGVSGGVPALVAYGALLVLVGRRVWQVVRDGPPVIAGVAVGLIGFVAQQQFLFPLAEVDPIAWLLAGVVVAATQPSKPIAVLVPRVGAAVAGVVAAGACVVGLLGVLADRDVDRAVGALGRGDAASAVELSSQAVTRRPDVLRAHIALARAHTATGTIAGFDAAIETLDDALEWSPRDPILGKERASALATKAAATGVAADQQVAREAWEALAANDPNNAAILLELGVAEAIAGDALAAEATWSRAADLAPRSPTPLINLAQLAIIDGRRDDAIAALDEAERRAPNDPSVRAAREQLNAAG